MSMRDKRILFLIPAAAGIGGVETWLDHIVPYLSARGWDPLVALARGLKYNLPDPYRELHPHLPTVEIDGRGFDREGRIRTVVRCLRKTKPGIVVPLGLCDAYDAYFRCRAQGNREARLVLRNQGLLGPLLAQVQDYGPYADLVVSDSRLVTRFAIEHVGLPKDRVRHLPNGADPPTGDRSSTHSDQLRLGYVGRFSQGDKRILDLADLCEELLRRNVRCTVDVVGDGPADRDLRGRLETDRFRSMVQFYGRLQPNEVFKRIYPRLDVLLLFSSSESFGIVLVEAMMHGVVPVTSQYLGFHTERLIRDEETGLSFPVGDMSAAADAVERLVNDRHLLSRLAAAGQAEVNGAYTWDRRLAAWHAVLESVLALAPITRFPNSTNQRLRSGRLDRLGVPPTVVDLVRRLRRRLSGPSVPAGGEEWPLFHRDYREVQLQALSDCVRRLEAEADERAMGGTARLCDHGI